MTAYKGSPQLLDYSATKGAIVAFTVEITRLEGKLKLSQNRDDEDYWNIVANLDKREDELSHGVAEAMRRQRPR